MKISNYFKNLMNKGQSWPYNYNDLASLKSDKKMITVGLDFGTHQTKVCIESKGGVELNYTFMKFAGNEGKFYYTLPSIIGVGKDNLLRYGFLPSKFKGKIVKYFKQGAFCTSSPNQSMSQEGAMIYSVWYIAFILFDLEEVFGQNFTIQMGAPTDSSHVENAKKIATRIVASAYRLVEDVFQNDKTKFLNTDVFDLMSKTILVPYTKEVKEDYGLLVFPEAYACLKPLISQKKIARGMSLMVDIGGGTTDISFFTIENGIPQVYDFYSINKGLNYLTCVDEKPNNTVEANVKSSSDIDNGKIQSFQSDVMRICKNIREKLLREFHLQQNAFKDEVLTNALKNRPLVYCGGGSTFEKLRVPYAGFKDMKQISEKEWNVKSISQLDEIVRRGLCPILSTSYGLSISTEKDDIVMKPFMDIFEGVRGAVKDSDSNSGQWSKFGEAYGGFSYSDDYSAWK